MAIHPSPEVKAFPYPKIRKFLKTNKDGYNGNSNVSWSAKFWPYGSSEDPPIFCLSNRWDMLVCQISEPPEQNMEVEVIRQFEVKPSKDGEKEETDQGDQYCSCAWAYISEDEPLLLGAGDPGFIRVFDVVQGTLLTTLIGHGAGVINDLATHPKYPWIIASASLDQSIRVWDLRRWKSKHESSTIIICGMGNGHRESVLTVAWHDSGRYLVSGGFDNRICVWTIPDLSPQSDFWNEISPAQAKRHGDTVRLIHFPHFMTSAIHKNTVDCVRFWGDLVFSKAAEECKIVCWRITGFNSNLSPPDAILAPKASEHLDTRNGFTRTMTTDTREVTKISTLPAYTNLHPYQRLLEFHLPHSEPFFIRFEILKQSPQHPDIHAVLSAGNTRSTLQFWDLEALDRGYDHATLTASSSGTRGGRRGGHRGASRRGMAQIISKGSRSRVNVLSGLSRSESAPLTATSGTNSIAGSVTNGTPSRPSSPTATTATTTTRSSPPFPVRSSSTDATSTNMSEPLPNAAAAAVAADGTATTTTTTAQTEPPEDRIRFPLKDHNAPLRKAHHTVDLRELSPEVSFTTRGVAWSPCGRWCVVAGEMGEVVGVEGGGRGGWKGKSRGNVVQVGGAVVMGREL